MYKFKKYDIVYHPGTRRYVRAIEEINEVAFEFVEIEYIELDDRHMKHGSLLSHSVIVRNDFDCSYVFTFFCFNLSMNYPGLNIVSCFCR